MLNRLLQRQLQKHFGGTDKVPPEFKEVFTVINESYDHYEKDRKMLERAIELSSDEMIALNNLLRKESDELKKVNSDLETQFKNIEEVFFSVDMIQYKILQISSTCEKVYGYKPEDFYENANLWFEVTLEDDRKIIENNHPVMKSGKGFSQEYRIRHANGSIRWLENKISPTLNKDGVLVRIDGIVSDISARKEAEEKLKSTILELRKTNSELDKFVYSVSHDLRAPLTSVLGVINICQETTEDQFMIDHLGMIKKSITKLDGFISDILDYSRNSRLKVKSEKIDFREILHDVTDHLKSLNAPSKEVNINVNISNEKPFLSDKSRVSIIFNNLISNAVRYLNPVNTNPFVNVKIDMSDTEANIIVEDNGIGISRENQQKIFDMFYRVSEDSVGSGLGLYIVKETINKLHGDIDVESQPGTGTTFHMRIPNLMFQ